MPIFNVRKFVGIRCISYDSATMAKYWNTNFGEPRLIDILSFRREVRHSNNSTFHTFKGNTTLHLFSVSIVMIYTSISTPVGYYIISQNIYITTKSCTHDVSWDSFNKRDLKHLKKGKASYCTFCLKRIKEEIAVVSCKLY